MRARERKRERKRARERERERRERERDRRQAESVIGCLLNLRVGKRYCTELKDYLQALLHGIEGLPTAHLTLLLTYARTRN